jgi:hypothetical protein
VEVVPAGSFVVAAGRSYTAAAEEASAGSRCHIVVVEGRRSRCTAVGERESDMV